MIPVLFVLVGLLPQPPKDPQATIEPRAAPGAGQELMKRMVGDWEVTKVFYPRSGDPTRQSGACHQTMIHEGRFLQSDFTFKGADGIVTTGMGLLGFESRTGQFTSIWTDSRSTRISFRQSQDRFDGKEIVLFSKNLGDSKDERRSRTVSRLEDGGNKLTHRQFGIAANGEERLVMELLMTRKEAHAK